MKRTLTIDQGNSTAKITIFSADEIVETVRMETLDIESLNVVIEKHSPQRGIYSTVGAYDAKFIESLRVFFGEELLIFTHTTPVPMMVDYATPKTLGADRVAAAVGAITMGGGCPLVIADAGSALTIDYVDGEGVFRGGNICAGIKMRLSALHNYTNALPPIDTSGSIPPIGTDTPTALRSGAVRGVVAEIMDIYAQFVMKNSNTRLILTGGDAGLIAPFIQERCTSLIVEPHLTALGLNTILQYNENL